MLWEEAWRTRGMEEMMMDMAACDETAVYHFDRICESLKPRMRIIAESGADILYFLDDIGMQNSIIMSAEMYREWVKPRFKSLIDEAKKINPDILVAYHSCGFIIPFVEDLIEAGVDVLESVQSECMDFAELHGKYGERLSFWGTIGTQSTMPFGTPEEVKKHVRRNRGVAGKKGGLLCAPTHVLEPEVPWENVMAYVEACREEI
jgi:uroporphyrinogen decarboxylase